jgi:hypothetical protein
MFSKIKKIFCWEIILFALTNLAILMNIFLSLNIDFGEFITKIDNLHGSNIEGPGLFAGLVFITLLLMPIFVVLKYLSMPLCFLIIKKWSKNKNIKYLIKTTAENYKLQAVVFIFALFLDIIFAFFNCLYFYNENYILMLGRQFFFGGLTGSYLVIFLFLFVRKKLRKLV